MTSLPPACNASALIAPFAPSDVSNAVFSEPAGATSDSSSKIVSVAFVNRPGVALLKFDRMIDTVRFGCASKSLMIGIKMFVVVWPSAKMNVPARSK